MSGEADFGKLYQEIQDLISVTLTIPATRTEAELSFTITNVLARQTRQEDVITGDQYVDGFWCTFHMWEDNLLTIIPKEGMKITDDDGDTYEVKSVEHCNRRQRFKCVCLRVRG